MKRIGLEILRIIQWWLRSGTRCFLRMMRKYHYRARTTSVVSRARLRTRSPLSRQAIGCKQIAGMATSGRKRVEVVWGSVRARSSSWMKSIMIWTATSTKRNSLCPKAIYPCENKPQNRKYSLINRTHFIQNRANIISKMLSKINTKCQE